MNSELDNKFATCEGEIKMVLFARWIATCYADTHMDSNMNSDYDEGFNSSEAISILNRKTGYWYAEQFKHFNDVVYPNYVKNGTVENMGKFINDYK